MKQIQLNIRYQLLCAPFWISVVLSAMVYAMGMLGRETNDILYYYTVSTTFGVFYPLAACIAMLPSGIIFSRELHSGNYNYCVSRTSLTRYLGNKTISCAVIGGLTLVSGPIIVTLSQLHKYPFVSGVFLEIYSAPELNVSLSDLVAAQNWFLFYAIKLYLVFLHGCSVILIGFAVAPYSKDSFVILFSPFVLLRLYDMFISYRMNAIFGFSTLFNGFSLDVPFNNTWGFIGYATGVQLVLWILCFFVAFRGMTKRWHYA
jgi:hypothetical protein